MRKRPKYKVQCQKLMDLFILSLFLTILFPVISAAEYKIYLRNGQVMTGVERIEKEAEKVKIYRKGIMLELSENSIAKIEEYNKILPTKEKGIEETETPAEEESPGYLRTEEAPYYREKEADKEKKLQQLRKHYQLIIDKLNRIEELEKRSEELSWEMREKWSPRKARIAREEKAEIDKELEGLTAEKDSLLSQKKDLEAQIEDLERQ